MSNTDGCITSAQLDKIINDMDRAYEDWEEEERRMAREKCIMDKLRSLPPGDVQGRMYQLLRLQFSEAYFQGHPLYCGDEWTPSASSVIEQAICSVVVRNLCA
jgi:hypothetical protein